MSRDIPTKVVVSEHQKAAQATSSVRSDFTRATSISINFPQSFHQVPFHFLAVSLVHVQFLGPHTDQIPSISAVRRRRPQCWWGRVQIPSQPRFLESKWKLENAGTALGFTKVENWQFRFGDSAKLSKVHDFQKLKIPNSQHIVQSSHIQQLLPSLHTILSSLTGYGPKFPHNLL